MERDEATTPSPERKQRAEADEQVRRELGRRAVSDQCARCGKAPDTFAQRRELIEMPVKVREYGKARPERKPISEVVTIRDEPSRKLASEANHAEKRARLIADHSVYRAIVRSKS